MAGRHALNVETEVRFLAPVPIVAHRRWYCCGKDQRLLRIEDMLRVVQRLGRLTVNQETSGSTPPRSTNTATWRSGYAADCNPVQGRFDSCRRFQNVLLKVH